MTVELPGPHHCIGTARSVADIMFRSLRARCAANGGTLSLEELESLYPHIIASFSSGFDLFELRHRRCTLASMHAVEMPFARDKILSGVLRVCGENAARAACSLQIQQLGEKWIGEVFDGLAQFVYTHVSAEFDTCLINAYVESATAPGNKVSFPDLLKRKSAREVLGKCVDAFEQAAKSKSTIKDACDCVNEVVSRRRGIAGPHIGKITEDQTRYLLEILAEQMRGAVEESSNRLPNSSRPPRNNSKSAS